MKNLNHAKLVARCNAALDKFSAAPSPRVAQVAPRITLKGTPIIFTGEASREIAAYYARKEFNGD